MKRRSSGLDYHILAKEKIIWKKNYTRKLNVKEEVILIPLMLQKIVKVLFPYSTNSKKSES